MSDRISPADALGHLYVMACRHADATGVDIDVVNRLCELAVAETAIAQGERDRAIRARERTQQWYAERIERLKDLAKEKGFWPEVAAILANGTVSPTDPPTYARQLNVARHRAEHAEVRAERAEAELARLRGRGLG